MYKFTMISIPSVLVVLLCNLTSQAIAWDENSLSRPVITRNHRRLKGFTFSTFHSVSLVSCGLKCQRNPRCVSTNFRKVSSLDETEGVCELNKMGALLSIQLIEGKELEYDQAVYTQFYDMKVRKCFVFCFKYENTAEYSQLLKNGLIYFWKRFVLLLLSNIFIV